MKAFSSASLQSSDHGDSLHFGLTYERGWLLILLSIAACVLALWKVTTHHSLAWLILIGVAAASEMGTFIRGNSAGLTVTQNDILAGHNVGPSWEEQRYSASQINSIRYGSGGEGAPSGLYMKVGWQEVCLLPDISEQTANEIVAAISQRFPYFGTGDTTPSSLLFGASQDPIRLKLLD